MAGGVYRAGDCGSQFAENFAKAFAVGCGLGGVRRAAWSALTVRQVVADDSCAGSAAGVGDVKQQGRIGVGPGAVRQKQADAGRFVRAVPVLAIVFR